MNQPKLFHIRSSYFYGGPERQITYLTRSLAERGVESMVAISRRLEPNPATRATYERGFGMYRALYPALRPLQQDGGPR